MIHRLLALVAVTAICLAGITACGEREDVAADFVFISGTQHHTLDPQRMSWSHDFRVIDCLLEPLVRTTVPDLQLEGGAAERWEISDDKLTYTFHLRENGRWSNGETVTAHDFVYAWQRAMLPDMAADYTQLFWIIDGAPQFYNWRREQLENYRNSADKSPEAAQQLLREAIEHFNKTVGLNAVDDRTLVVRLKQPTSYFLDLCAFATLAPVHRASVDAMTSINAQTGMRDQDSGWTRPGKFISNGPYQLHLSHPGELLRMKANEHYWDRANMRNSSILEKIIKDPQVMLLQYEAGEVDWLPDIPTADPIAADMLATKRKDLHYLQTNGTYFYMFNCNAKLPDGRDNPLADARVRKALAMAIDRKAIVERVTRLNQPVAGSFVPPGVIDDYHPPVEAGVTFDPQAARALLAEAGYADGQSLRGLSILYSVEGFHQHIAQAIKAFWQEHLNVTVEIEAATTRELGERKKTQKFTISRGSWFGDYRDPTTFLDYVQSENGNNDAKYQNPAYDRLLAEAAKESDDTQRMKLLRDAEAMMLADQPITPIFHYTDMHLFDPEKVKGLALNSWKRYRLDRVSVQREADKP